MEYRTITEQQTAKRNATILARYIQLRKENPGAKKCRLCSQIASEGHGVNTMNGVRGILIKSGVYA